MEELSEDLASKTGRDGKNSFAFEDMNNPRSVFLVAFSGNEAIACGALRQVNEDTCEIKRMFSRLKGKGIGSSILQELERHAVSFRYKKIWLETGIENQKALNFYLRHGYRVRDNFGKYQGRAECICLEKVLAHPVKFFEIQEQPHKPC